MNDLEYLDEPHIYLCNGIQIPCVSDIIKFKFPDLYKGVPTYILNNKAQYGTRLHELVEKYLLGNLSIDDLNFMNIDPNIKISIKQFARKKEKIFKFSVKSIEQHVCYKDLYAGTYDILTKNNYLIDIKTTRIVHIDNETLNAPLNLQISLYYLALGITKDIGYCLHMPKGDDVSIYTVKCWKKKDLINLLKEYEQANKGTSDIY